MTIGARQFDQGMRMRTPSYSTSSPRMSARMTRSLSANTASLSGRSPRLWTALSPTPMPRMARPPESSSIVAMLLAITAGCRVTVCVTPVASAIRRVRAASTARISKAPRITECESATHTPE